MKKIKSYLKKFNKAINELSKFFFMARAKEFQEETIAKLTSLVKEAIALRKQKIKSKEENAANTMLCVENILNAAVNELKMWLALKVDDPNTAWDFLISAQRAIRTALQAHDIAKNYNAEAYISKLHALEKLLFPPQKFLSPAVIIERAQCSICGKEYGECTHLLGKAYMGSICCQIIKKIKKTDHVAFVEYPADKHARVVEITNDGITRDYMTWRILGKG
jgi:hypothetical protein